ncbi:MAG: CsgG/HfaB family protein, partial [Nitrospiraceae bacterium]
PEQHIQFVQTTGTSHWPKPPVKGTVWVKGHKGPGSDEALIVARGALLMKGYDVVERDKLGALLKEQETQLKYGDDRSQVSVGKLVGAQLVAFVETASTPGKGYYADGFDVSVTVRVVGVETGEVFSVGQARWTQPVASATYGIDQLTTQAVLRAFCPPASWDEASPQNGWSGRCRE